MKKYSILSNITFLVFAALIISFTVSCNNKRTAMVYGTKWNGLVRTPLVPPYQAPGSPPYSIKEDIKFSGGFGEIKGDISKYNFAIESASLRISNDKPGSNETWNDIWYVYYDSGVKADGSREVFLKGRCFLENKKLNPIHPVGSLDFDLRLVFVPKKPYHFVMNVHTTKKGTASDLQVSGNAEEPNGTIVFFPVK